MKSKLKLIEYMASVRNEMVDTNGGDSHLKDLYVL